MCINFNYGDNWIGNINILMDKNNNFFSLTINYIFFVFNEFLFFEFHSIIGSFRTLPYNGAQQKLPTIWVLIFNFFFNNIFYFFFKKKKVFKLLIFFIISRIQPLDSLLYILR